jgi:mannose-6-phosphate isomerase-like protein (cupin superfamily)
MALKLTTLHVDKPWGHEVIWADTELYVGKILHVNAGEALSLQYHREKDETLYVLSGYVRMEVGPSSEELEAVELRAGDAMRLRPGTVHRMEALEESDVLEVSTPHLDDLVRLDDRYGRIRSRG